MLQDSDRIDILGGCLNTDHPVLKESTRHGGLGFRSKVEVKPN